MQTKTNVFTLMEIRVLWKGRVEACRVSLQKAKRIGLLWRICGLLWILRKYNMHCFVILKTVLYIRTMHIQILTFFWNS